MKTNAVKNGIKIGTYFGIIATIILFEQKKMAQKTVSIRDFCVENDFSLSRINHFNCMFLVAK